jgi:hypothetical protein
MKLFRSKCRYCGEKVKRGLVVIIWRVGHPDKTSVANEFCSSTCLELSTWTRQDFQDEINRRRSRSIHAMTTKKAP